MFMIPLPTRGFLFPIIFITMEEKFITLIKSIIFKKYPSLYKVSVSDLMGEYENLSNTKFICKFKSEKCLSMEDQMEIDKEVKFLFGMIGPQPTLFKKPSILCFFDCGKGYEFQSGHGYIH